MASPATYMLDGFTSKDPRFVNCTNRRAGPWCFGPQGVCGKRKGRVVILLGGAVLVHRAGPVQALKLYKIGSLRNWSQGFLQNESPAL